MRETIDRARESDRACNSARTPDELRDAVHARRLARAALEFEAAMQQFEERNPLPAAILVDRCPIVIR
jgi:hypothetical protein